MTSKMSASCSSSSTSNTNSSRSITNSSSSSSSCSSSSSSDHELLEEETDMSSDYEIVLSDPFHHICANVDKQQCANMYRLFKTKPVEKEEQHMANTVNIVSAEYNHTNTLIDFNINSDSKTLCEDGTTQQKLDISVNQAIIDDNKIYINTQETILIYSLTTFKLLTKIKIHTERIFILAKYIVCFNSKNDGSYMTECMFNKKRNPAPDANIKLSALDKLIYNTNEAYILHEGSQLMRNIYVLDKKNYTVVKSISCNRAKLIACSDNYICIFQTDSKLKVYDFYGYTGCIRIRSRCPFNIIVGLQIIDNLVIVIENKCITVYRIHKYTVCTELEDTTDSDDLEKLCIKRVNSFYTEFNVLPDMKPVNSYNLQQPFGNPGPSAGTNTGSAKKSFKDFWTLKQPTHNTTSPIIKSTLSKSTLYSNSQISIGAYNNTISIFSANNNKSSAKYIQNNYITLFCAGKIVYSHFKQLDINISAIKFCKDDIIAFSSKYCNYVIFSNGKRMRFTYDLDLSKHYDACLNNNMLLLCNNNTITIKTKYSSELLFKLFMCMYRGSHIKLSRELIRNILLIYSGVDISTPVGNSFVFNKHHSKTSFSAEKYNIKVIEFQESVVKIQND